MEPVRVAIIGCGVIAFPYARDMAAHPELELAGAYDLDPERSGKLVAEHGGRVYDTLESLFADPSIEAVVNLTIHHAHREVSERALLAGKHVYSEKPLAMGYEEAAGLVALARERELELGCSPFTFLWSAAQEAGRRLRSGELGPVRVVFTEASHGRIESWHPAPAPFYGVGPLADVGVYPLTLVTALLGPTRRVRAYAATLKPDRVTKGGEPFQVSSPDFWSLVLELDSGAVLRMGANFYVPHRPKARTVEFHGDAGSLLVSSWFDRDATLERADFGEGYEPVEVGGSGQGFDWSIGLVEFARALREERRPRVTGEQAAHIVEVLEAAATSAREDRSVELRSSFAPPAPLEAP